MDFGLSEQQELLKSFARDFLEKECPERLVREMEEDERGYSEALWQGMAQQGWQGLPVPEADGGSGLSFLDLCILLEEFGRALVPGPFISTVVLGAGPVLLAGSETQRQALLPKLVRGELLMTLAFTEPSARFDAAGVELRAERAGDGFVLRGRKLFVPDAHVADLLVVAARSGGSGEDGITLFLVEGTRRGSAARC